MMRAALRRVIQLVVVLVFVSFFSFSLISLVPGDPVVAIVGFASPAQFAQVRHQIGLDRPFLVQYLHWLGGFAHGNLGQVYSGPTGRSPVSTAVAQSLPVTLELMAFAMVLTLLISIPLGILSAYRSGSVTDKVITAGAFGSIALPDFALAIILAYWVGVKLGWLPTSGYVHPSANLVENVKTLTLPAFSLAVGQIAAYMRLLRSDMIATLQEDYILMAKSKGIPTRRILWRHALRPSSLTLLTVAGLNVGALIGGTIVIENLFNIPGMGHLLYFAIFGRQFVELQSLVAVIAIGYVLVNVGVDILYTILDPRIRDARAIA
jgi:peptide/nickel transport system permease protein